MAKLDWVKRTRRDLAIGTYVNEKSLDPLPPGQKSLEPQACRECGKKLAPHDLVRHCRNLHNKFKCKACGKIFVGFLNVRAHIQKAHS